MLRSTLALIFTAGFAAAQTATAMMPMASNTNPACSPGVEAIVNSCLASTTPQLEGCEANDWSCMCSAQQAIMTCYNNCLADSRLFGAQQQETQWCAAAKAYDTTSTTIMPSTTLATTAATDAATTSDSSSPSGTSSAATSGMTGNAASGMTASAGAGGMMAMIIGAMALL